MQKILWIAPNLNHYKLRFLKKLHARFFDISVLAGSEENALGHKTDTNDSAGLRITRIHTAKSTFHKSWTVYLTMWHTIKNERPTFVLMPCEKKHMFLILYLYVMRFIYPFMLITYTHPLMRSRNLKYKRLNRYITIAMFRMYDRVIFYTQQSMHYAVKNGILPKAKAAYANNTLDTDAINALYKLMPPPDDPSILFIGRLIPSKRIDLLLKYYTKLKTLLPSLKLVIIGDGPESHLVQSAAANNNDIEWKGAIVDEATIAKIMNKTSLVFIPGHSGLSIVHAFAYAKPYITLATYPSHPPEIDYLKNNWNGYILSGDIEKDTSKLAEILSNSDLLESLSNNALETAKSLSINNWCDQINTALKTMQ